MENKDHLLKLYENEHNILNHAMGLHLDSTTKAELESEFIKIRKAYKRLLSRTGTMIRVSDSSHRQLVDAQNELRKSLREVQQLVTEKNQFVKIAARDLRDPLCNIIISSEIMLDMPDIDPQEFKDHLNISIQESRKMTDLLEDLIDINELEDGQYPVAWEEIDLIFVASQVIEGYEAKAENKNLAISIDAPHDRELLVNGDWKLLNQALSNLVENAIHYSYEGEKIEITVDKKNDYVRFIIEDFGPGISPQKMAHVFNKFSTTKEDKVDRIGTSTRLGLYIAKLIADNLKGSISCVSEQDKGTAFTLSLPAYVE